MALWFGGDGIKDPSVFKGGWAGLMWLARWSYRLIHVRAMLFYKANCLAQIAQMWAIWAYLEFMRGILEEEDLMSRAYNPH